jgi:Dcp1-like decapping family
MKFSRRSRLTSSGSSKRPKTTPASPSKARPQPESPPKPTPTTSALQVQNTTTVTTPVTAADRYEKNLKSLRRIDPTIVSIIDTFSHICLYRLHEGKWDKVGYEGSSFLFERYVCGPSSLCASSHRSGMKSCIPPLWPFHSKSYRDA